MSRTAHRNALAWAATIALCAWSMAAHAQGGAAPHTFALNWVRGPGAAACISSSELAERIEELLGPVFRAPDGATRAIEGLIAKAPSSDGFHVELKLVDRSGEVLGERAFDSDAPSCDAASAPVLLVVALMIDPSAGERGLPPELLGLLEAGATPGADLLAEIQRERAEGTLASAEVVLVNTSSQRGARVAAPRPQVTSVEEEERAPEHGRAPNPNERQGLFELTLAPLLGFEIQPNIALGAAAGIRLVTSGFALELGFNHWLASEIASTDPSSGRRVVTNLEASGVSFRTCFDAMREHDVSVTPCAGAALLVRSFESSALGTTHERPRNSFGPLASLDVRYFVTGQWFALAGAGAVMLLPSDTFYYIDWAGQAQVFYEPSLFGFWGELGVGVRL